MDNVANNSDKTDEIFRKVEPFLKCGLSLHKACLQAQIPKSTVYDLYKKNNIDTKRRNTDILAAAFFNRVEITDPEGFQGHEPGDVLLYSVFQKHYQPRPDAKEDRPDMLTDRTRLQKFHYIHIL